MGAVAQALAPAAASRLAWLSVLGAPGVPSALRESGCSAARVRVLRQDDAAPHPDVGAAFASLELHGGLVAGAHDREDGVARVRQGVQAVLQEARQRADASPAHAGPRPCRTCHLPRVPGCHRQTLVLACEPHPGGGQQRADRGLSSRVPRARSARLFRGCVAEPRPAPGAAGQLSAVPREARAGRRCADAHERLQGAAPGDLRAAHRR